MKKKETIKDITLKTGKKVCHNMLMSFDTTVKVKPSKKLYSRKGKKSWKSSVSLVG